VAVPVRRPADRPGAQGQDVPAPALSDGFGGGQTGFMSAFHVADARRVPPTARPAPGVADGYLVSQGAAVTVSALTALISIHGSVHIASEASLAELLPVVEGRLRELARRIDFNQY
jgi:hypothetical protein